MVYGNTIRKCYKPGNARAHEAPYHPGAKGLIAHRFEAQLRRIASTASPHPLTSPDSPGLVVHRFGAQLRRTPSGHTYPFGECMSA